jgi:Ca2+-binding RTX toxin-like protein
MEIYETAAFSGGKIVYTTRAKLLDPSYQFVSSVVIGGPASTISTGDYAVVELDNGNVVAIWSDEVSSSASATGVFGRVLTANGGLVSDMFAVNTYTDGRQIEPRVTALDGGGFVVTWKSGYGQDGSDWGQFAQVFADDGSKVGAEIQVNDIVYGIQYQGTPVALEGGGFVIVFLAGTYLTATDSAVLAQAFDGAGNKVGDAVVVDEVDVDDYPGSTATPFFTEPYATALEGGGFAVTWWGGNTDQMIYSRAFAVQQSGSALADTLTGTNGREYIDAGDGDDVITGADGNDTLIGGAGADSVDGGAGDDVMTGDGLADVILGDSASETLTGSMGDESIIGGAGADTIAGAGGDDWMLGGSGADIFLFADGFGSDVIADFEDGSDSFVFDGVTGAASFSDLTVIQIGTDTRITVTSGGSDAILLSGTQATDIDASDFDFI